MNLTTSNNFSVLLNINLESGKIFTGNVFVGDFRIIIEEGLIKQSKKFGKW